MSTIMERICIENIGPITSIDIKLNKINVIMGPQSSGKSTIAKVISFCQWVEKRYILDGEFKYSFFEQFIDFHRIDENYFSAKSLIYYESDFVEIKYEGKDFNPKISKKGDSFDYPKSKNIYIPAERNFVSVIPNLGKYKETNDNIMSFLYDWYDTKKRYSKKESFPILDLGINYHHIEDTDSDILTLNKQKKEISLKNASSGLQSVIPLVLIIDYLTKGFYDKKQPPSIFEAKEMANFILNNIDELGVEITEDFTIDKEVLQRILRIRDQRLRYHYSRLIIEEPEQNLFPETQRDLIYYILEAIESSKFNHKLLLTTHSPYVLYALNNCIMGYKVKEDIPKDELEEFKSREAWISPDCVSIWEIEKNKGTIKSIKDEKTGTVSKHYFNKVMNEIMNEYYDMLNFLSV